MIYLLLCDLNEERPADYNVHRISTSLKIGQNFDLVKRAHTPPRYRNLHNERAQTSSETKTCGFTREPRKHGLSRLTS